MISCVCGASFEYEWEFKVHVQVIHRSDRVYAWRVPA